MVQRREEALIPAVLDTSAVLQGKSRRVAEHKGGEDGEGKNVKKGEI